jgi:hypothetical protein
MAVILSQRKWMEAPGQFLEAGVPCFRVLNLYTIPEGNFYKKRRTWRAARFACSLQALS